MTENALLLIGNPLLRQTASLVTDFESAELAHWISAMESQMLVSEGLGIAAPQLGISKQILIVASRPTKRYPDAPTMSPTIMCNPSVDIVNNSLIKDWEGCLSVPGIRALVPRYQSVSVRYQDPQGLTHAVELSDFPARVFQHEFDHLQGMVYLDRIESTLDIIADSEYLKRIACQTSQ